MVIDFGSLGGPVFSGRESGKDGRKKYFLDIEDSNKEISVLVFIPENTMVITNGFFLGLFEKSILFYGSKEKFFRKYRFNVSGELKTRINKYVERVLRGNSKLLMN